MLTFCTLFDYNYIHYGVTMHESLLKHCKEFHLYIFAFDTRCYDELIRLSLSNVTVISLSEFEDEKLLEIKPSRSKSEYCWTCTPSIILYVLENFPVTECTYIDADLYFFSDPQILITELGENSILLTSHNYSPKNLNILAGIYCVQFMTFRKDVYGLKALNWWRDACIEWCYARFEDGKFGDQRYLDDWLTRFEKVFVLKNEGGGVAPWNVQKYKVVKKGNQLFINNDNEIIFYHFHNMGFEKQNQFNLGYYELDNNTIQKIYKPYLKILLANKARFAPDFDSERLTMIDYFLIIKRFIMRILSKRYNLYYLREIR
ncbi:MAG: glycosyl transferase [Opitutaceae bacterium]|nr:glycosyl transferase [Cytophagales bacterium]